MATRNNGLNVRTLWMAALLVFSWTGTALAVDAVTGASRRVHNAGSQNVGLWITGRGFQPGLTVMVSGLGIVPAERAAEVVPQANRFDGGLGDGIAYYFDVALDAPSGTRSITVTNPDGSTATGVDLIEIVGDQPPPDGEPPPPPPEPPAQEGTVDVVTRASPRFANPGEQVNLWITGRVFNPGAQVSFNVGGLVPAELNGVPLAPKVTRNAESENGELDGIEYYLQVGDVPPGIVDITVTNPDGSKGRGAGLFEIVPVGGQPTPEPGDGSVDAITGASPRAARSGRNVSLWVWGTGFELGAEISFSNPGVRSYASPEVVVRSTSHPGFSGVRNFLLVDDNAAPGPVDITVTNPNGTTKTVSGLLDIIPNEGGAIGGNGANGPCPDLVTAVESITGVQPLQLARGDTVRLLIDGRGFACGSSIVIPGGGLVPVNTPELVTAAADPFATQLFWTLEIADDAELGARDVTVVNPNNSAKTQVAAFEIVGARATKSGDGVAFCAAHPDTPAIPLWAWLFVLFGRRRRA